MPLFTPIGGGGIGKATVTATTGSPTVDTSSRAGKTIYKFTGSGSITVGTPGFAEILVVGGGGRGGASTGNNSNTAGGGAGGVLYKAQAFLPQGSLTVTVGASQNSSSVADYYGAAGGMGASGNAYTGAFPGASGGSGGGGLHGGAGGAGTPGQGNAGSSDYRGGGGGAGAAGSGEVGGIGIQNSITGTSIYYGGGGSHNTTSVLGGGGGSRQNGTANTGGGGGGRMGESDQGQTLGGSGVIIVVIG